jgi:hypothetical protein
VGHRFQLFRIREVGAGVAVAVVELSPSEGSQRHADECMIPIVDPAHVAGFRVFSDFRERDAVDLDERVSYQHRVRL